MPCAQLLASLAVLILAFPFLEGSAGGHLVLDAIHLTVIVMVVRAVVRTPGSERIALGLALIAVAAQIAYFALERIWLGALAIGGLGVFQAYAIWSLLRYVLQDERITTDELFAAASMYVLMAMCWACAYTVLETLAPGSFFVNPANNPDQIVNWWDLVYFSFTTLTSVGFGEITPVTSQARSLVMLEQVAGVLFLALLVARMTGTYGAAR
jgi:CBS domain containing-hemolysin-like protein